MATERITLNSSGPTVSRNAWELYKFLIKRMNNYGSSHVWVSNGRIKSALRFRDEFIPSIQHELVRGGYVSLEPSEFGNLYTLGKPSRKECNV